MNMIDYAELPASLIFTGFQEKNSIDILTATLDRDGFVLERAAPWSIRIDLGH